MPRPPRPLCVVTQRAGEMLVFPGGHWHVVVHTMGPTIAVCGQCVRASGASRTVAHIAAWRSLAAAAAALGSLLDDTAAADAVCMIVVLLAERAERQAASANGTSGPAKNTAAPNAGGPALRERAGRQAPLRGATFDDGDVIKFNF